MPEQTTIRVNARSRFNYLGTYTFASLADYEAGKPILYTRMLGFPASHDNPTARLMGRFFGVRDIGLVASGPV